jgi:hypothetical protein
MSDELYLAVWEDRHSDNGYAIFTELNKAIEWCKDGMNVYDGEYEFFAPDWDWMKHWDYYMDAGDDCPKFSVRKIPLDPAPK